MLDTGEVSPRAIISNQETAAVAQNAYDISVRKTLQKNRRAGLLVAVALILLSAAFAAYVFLHNVPPKNDSYAAFFSDDDGQTYFKGSALNLAPFDHDGKTADLAVVCTDGKRDFVAYLQRYTPEARKQLQDLYDANRSAPYKVIDMMASPQISLEGMEIKVPGKDNPWISRSKGRLPDIQSPNDGDIVVVHP